MRITSSIFAATLQLSAWTALHAEGLYFGHQDWELACDNTGTCRAAGYQPESTDSGVPVSVRLTREAGHNSKLIGDAQIAFESDQEFDQAKPIHLWINQQDYGELKFANDDAIARLSAKQVAAIVQGARQQQQIEFKGQNFEQTLSDAGLSAVLLKFDDYQKRSNTPEALLAKGQASTKHVLAKQALPTIYSPKLTAQQETIKPNDIRYAALIKKLRASTDQNSCNELWEEDQQSIKLYHLSNKKQLLEHGCNTSAYNRWLGYWLIDADLQGAASLVTPEGTWFEQGRITESFKGRGVGDCVEVDESTWNGQKFVPSKSWSTGMCKGFPGGAWELPTLDSKVVIGAGH